MSYSEEEGTKVSIFYQEGRYPQVHCAPEPTGGNTAPLQGGTEEDVHRRRVEPADLRRERGEGKG